ncbi:putative transcription factor interactor and regulator LisH family [Lupinus albus]|uniref:Putative transcription factor interactor and regulator LisH family n=1 Tax=Lupinus albus TaxID=3870 RepID=A0A6A4QHS9_LUPAL|nr:putative transcription factor interactor and regulator LisH family [Lupinus albus]
MEKYSSVCNLVVKFLLEENYLLSAFELLHELIDNGHHIHAIRLQQFFSNPNLFPPHQISNFNSLPLADPQTLLHEKEAAEEKFAITNYELRLAQEDILKLQAQLHTKTHYLNKSNEAANGDVSLMNNVVQTEEHKRNNSSFNDLGPMKDTERRDLNCAVKQYLLMAGYNLTAMTFYEEVTNHNMDIWKNNHTNTNTLIPDALRHYYYHYLSSTSDLAQEKIALIRDNDEKLNEENKSLLKDKELPKSLEELHKDLKNKGNMVEALKQSLENQTKDLNACKSEITKLKMHISQSESLTKYKEEIKNLQMEIEWLKEKNIEAPVSRNFDGSENEIVHTEDKAIVIHEDKGAISYPIDSDTALDDAHKADAQSHFAQTLDDYADKHEDTLHALSNPANANSTFENIENAYEQNVGKQEEDNILFVQLDSMKDEPIYEKTGLGTIQILADTLPKIVPYVLINHREELLPLMMCAIERHPDSSTRDSLTHTLFNLIKRPDENQRRIIMDACVALAKNVGEMRTEIELLPQCWEQINHMYEERRLLVAQSCGELAEFVRPEIRDSLILSIVHQLIEDSATVVREAATHNLAMLLPLFLNTDKYFKVEKLMFQLLCDPSGVVVETTLKELVPAVIKWGNKLDNVLRVLLSHIISSAKSCPTLSGVEGDIESHLHALGEREWWNIDVLLRMLVELLPSVHQKAIETCPFQSIQIVFSTSLLELYARGDVEWDAFEWMHVECFPKLIQLAYLLPGKEDNLRSRISKFLLSVSQTFGDSYTTCIMLPVFLTALGNDADFTFFPSAIHSRIKGLRPKSAIAERLSTLCVLPLLLAGVLGSLQQGKLLTEYMRKLLVKENSSIKQTSDIINAVRFIWFAYPTNINLSFIFVKFIVLFPLSHEHLLKCSIYEENHSMVFNILWEMVVSSNVNMKINAAKLLKVIVPYIDPKVASTNALPALVTLGSEQNLSVKCASIDAFGAVALHFKNEMIVDKIRVQMGAFLEDGSHEVTIAVIHALVLTISQLTAMPTAASIDLMHRRDRANAFCEAIRALDATDLSANSVRDLLLPAIQNLLRDLDALDPAQKEALEIIMKERSVPSFESVDNNYKAKGAHRNLFSEGALHPKKDNIEQTLSETVVSPKDTRFRRIMLGHFGKIKGKSQVETRN